jgi:hypothetical protein
MITIEFPLLIWSAMKVIAPDLRFAILTAFLMRMNRIQQTSSALASTETFDSRQMLREKFFGALVSTRSATLMTTWNKSTPRRSQSSGITERLKTWLQSTVVRVSKESAVRPDKRSKVFSKIPWLAGHGA